MIYQADITGNRYGRLIAVERVNRQRWRCVCDCTNERIVSKYDLCAGKQKSCGCLVRELTIERNKRNITRGGLSHTPTGRSWNAMMNRCYNKNGDDYDTYGASGVSVCSNFRTSPAALIEAIGSRPNGMTLDRINTYGGYTCGKCDECIANGWPTNVRWASPTQQGRNQRTNHLVTIGGQTKCIAEWADYAGIGRSCIATRLKRGWTGLKLIDPAYNNERRVMVEGVSMRICELSRATGIPYPTLCKRLRKGLSGKDLIAPPDKRYSRK